ncbi:hypothetical protein SAMN03159417_04844 [Ralstonia sp. NFACC01]|nr:hypothetical protein SAMN03159417_04844 [Ralstonia sp. NFACC01]
MPESTSSQSIADALVQGLQKLAATLKEAPEPRRFSDVWGWQAPPLDRNDLVNAALGVAAKIEALDWSTSSEQVAGQLQSFADRTSIVTSTNAANLNQGPLAACSIVAFLYALELWVGRTVSVSDMKGVLALPVTLRRQSRVALSNLQDAMGDINQVRLMLATIKDAHDAAEDLPATQKDLADALKEVAEAKKAAVRHEVEAKQSAEEAEKSKIALAEALSGAMDVRSKLDSAYSAATSQGLASAFAKKSQSLGLSTWLWTGILAIALAAGGVIGWLRFPVILAAVTGKPDWGVVAVHITLSCLSLAPAVWISWVATKQIGQRFRLAEDYGYKAALAKAYEGYKAEAKTLDAELQAQLFSTALGRLDEIPLRLIETNVPGSPWHELLQSKEFLEFMQRFPNAARRLKAVVSKDPSEEAATSEKAAAGAAQT